MSYVILQLHVPSALTGRTSSSTCRCLSLHIPSFYSLTSTNSSNYLFLTSPEHEQRYWGPGETLPHNLTYAPQPNHYLNLQQEEVDLKCLLQGLRSSVEINVKDIKTKLCHPEDRVVKVEEKQGDMVCSHSISSSNSRQCDGGKHRSPSELQVCILHFYTKHSLTIPPLLEKCTYLYLCIPFY